MRSSVAQKATGGPIRILLVEDDQRLAGSLIRALGEKGYAVDHCLTGADAIAQVRAGVHELVLLGWMVADPDGLEVCRQSRNDGSAVPILVLTAPDREARARILALDAGADDCMGKPPELEELMARIHSLLRRARMMARCGTN
jgi:DNA-binding response OmpR family regulator